MAECRNQNLLFPLPPMFDLVAASILFLSISPCPLKILHTHPSLCLQQQQRQDLSISINNNDDDNNNMASTTTTPAPPADGVDFASLPWNINLADNSFYIQITTTTGEWTTEHFDKLEECVYSYKDRPLPVHPATTSLNYGTTIWEGIRAHRTAADKAVIFRPDRNYERMKRGAYDMCLPMPDKALFMKALQLAVQRNVHYLPPPGDGVKLYLRPMLLGTGQQLGLYPSPEMTFLVYVSPTGNYFSAATTGLNIHLETKRSRASKGGTGSTKCAGNYGIALRPLLDCKKQGFNDNLFLELETYAGAGSLESAVVQEMSAANVFFVMNNGEIVTPSLERGTILPGVTRDSVLRIIESFAEELKPAMMKSTGQDNVVASSRDLTVGEMKQATECFCTGTAAEICPIRRIATGEGDQDAFTAEFAYGATLPGGPVTSTLLKLLRQVMKGERTVEKNWLRDPFAPLEEFMA